jgi:hypothetical protein
MRATLDHPKKRSARCARCGAALGNADVTVCPARCDIGDTRGRFAFFQAVPLGLALLFVVFYPKHLHAALGVAAAFNLMGVLFSIRGGAVVSRTGVVQRESHPILFWMLISLFALPSVAFFAFVAFVHA